jgi:hypothetical protein
MQNQRKLYVIKVAATEKYIIKIAFSSTACVPVNTRRKGVQYYEMSRLWKKRMAYRRQKGKFGSGSTDICNGALSCLYQVQLRRKIINRNKTQCEFEESYSFSSLKRVNPAN